MTATKRIAVLGALCALVSTLFTGIASAKTEKVCNSSYCNTTDGDGLYVYQVIACGTHPSSEVRVLRGLPALLRAGRRGLEGARGRRLHHGSVLTAGHCHAGEDAAAARGG
ncbi:MAG: hypothetical protein QOI78_6567 [Actinomycetota bacterium]|nr:hypothetical protein [Actinomycetota bacterium]